MRIISVVNQKGGCGKTTVAINLAAALGKLEKKMLLIDLDPQAHASMGLNTPYERISYSTYDLLIEPRLKLCDAVFELSEDFHIIPSLPILSALEQELSGKKGRERHLGSKLARSNEVYDFVIIDSPPNVGILTFNALIASNEVIIPVEPSSFSLDGLDRLKETLELLESEIDHAVSMNVLINNLEKGTRFARDFVCELEKEHESILMNNTVSHSVRYKESAHMGVSIFEMKGVEHLQREFLHIAEEIEERVPILNVGNIKRWMARLHGPKIVEEGILFSLDAPDAESVYLTGEFARWSRNGIKMERNSIDGLWEVTLNLEPGEYEYRFIVDGNWVKDPKNNDIVVNEFGQENSLLIV